MAELPPARLNQRKPRDRSFALIVLGLVLLFPPFVDISLIPIKFGGVPFALLYIFFVWALLIVGAAWIAPALQKSREADDPLLSEEPSD